MKLCSDEHDEVCFEIQPTNPALTRGDACPLCEVMARLAEADAEVERLQAALDEATV